MQTYPQFVSPSKNWPQTCLDQKVMSLIIPMSAIAGVSGPD